MLWKKNNKPVSLPASGVTIGQTLTRKNTTNLFICLLRGLIIFLAAMGTVGCYMSSFSIKYNLFAVFTVLLFSSFFLSFLYYNRIVLNVGYILFFAAYAPLLFVFKKYINSGYAAILNQTMDIIDEYYILPARQQYVEEVTNRSMAVTMFCCFVGIFFCLILNAIISGYMSILITFIASFPFIAAGLFFERSPDTVWFTFVLLSWTMVYILKRSKLYKNQRKKDRNYKYKRDVHIFSYKNEARGLFQCCILITVSACCLIGVLLMVYPKDVFHTPLKWNSYKESTDEFVRNYMIVGFSVFFNRYDSAGGISGGKLGGVSSVRPDYETDLIVRFTPYSTDTVYLPAFYGNRYVPYENGWDLEVDISQASTNSSNFNKEADCIRENTPADTSAFSGKMEITNVGADPDYLYHPYFTDFTDTLTNRFGIMYFDNYYMLSEPNNSHMDFTYYQNTNLDFYTNSKRQQYSDYELEVPEEIKETLLQICNEEGFGGTEDEIIKQVQTFLEKDYVYSMKPGLTPRNKDFVTYFLTQQKKGYCVYFASAATLLLRTMGIPARYVEGYTIPYEKVLDSDLVEGASYDDWFTGTAPLGETAVIETDVSDAYAHAWVEVFQPGFGWKPVEVTSSQREDSEESSNAFWDFFSSAFGNDGSDDSSDSTQRFTVLNRNLSQHSKTIAFYLLLAVFLLFTGVLSYRKWRWYQKLHNPDLKLRVVCQYQYIYQLLQTLYGDTIQNKDHTCILNLVNKYYHQDALNYEDWISLVKKASYSQQDLTPAEFQITQQTYTQLKYVLKQKLSFTQKIRTCFLHIPK